MCLNWTSEWKVVTISILKSFRCSISSVLIYYVPESNIRVKSYDHSNFSRAFIEQFRAPTWVMSPNRTSVWRVMTVRIFGSSRCSISSVLIYYVPESEIHVKSYDHSNFPRASVDQFRASWYIMSPNRIFVWKAMTIQIYREIPLFNFERLDILFPGIGHPREKLWPFEFLENFRCSISSVSLSYVPESEIHVKSYDHSNFPRASVDQFRASW